MLVNAFTNVTNEPYCKVLPLKYNQLVKSSIALYTIESFKAVSQ